MYLHASISRCLGCFFPFAVVNNVLSGPGMVEELLGPCFQASEVELLDHLLTEFNFLKNHRMVFHSGNELDL